MSAPGAEAQEGLPPGTERFPRDSLDGAALVLDAPVSRTAYVLGPGDVLTVSVFGGANLLHTVPVSPDGTLVIPSLGLVPVLGLNLEEAEARVRELVARFYRDVSVNLTLTRARLFRIFVVGAVEEPGLRVGSPATRVSEVVPDRVGDLVRRNALIRRASGETVDVDLARFRLTGDLSANPALREGDVVLVRPLDRTVDVYGRVHFPGRYEYRQGESLAQLLSIVNGGGDFPSDAADSVRLSRFIGPEQREFHAFSRAEALGALGETFLLEPFDAVYVAALSNFKEQQTASIRGEVLRPGVYPIRPDTTTLRDLVAMAGGFTAEASLSDATLTRRTPDAEGEGARQLENIPLEFLDQDELRIVQIRARGAERNVVVDFEGIFIEGLQGLNLTLQAGDVVAIPERRDGVVVLGAVLEPGIIAYAPGRTIDYFVQRAGGFSERADRDDLLVLKARLGTRTDPDDVRSIDPGDQIIVPFEVPRTFLERVAAADGIVSTVSGFILTVLAIERLYDAVRN